MRRRRVQEFRSPHGRIQIVELGEYGLCHVGYLPKGGTWLHWGLGEGGYDATVERFGESYTFNPKGKPEPRSYRGPWLRED